MRSLLDKLRYISLTLLAGSYAALPTAGIQRPTFILGCGRSGTTILGTALSYHAQITYLNEPRHLWFSCYPETDIWSIRAAARSGKMMLTEADINSAKSRKLRRLFHFETLKTGRPVLVEKLPINSFRLPFIQAIFPDARYVHILRNGIEVAKSIEKLAETKWFGANGYKWDQLVNYSSRRADTADLPRICVNNYERGLLEWRHSTEAVYDFLRHLPRESYYEISYDEFVDTPEDTVNRILSFIGLGESELVNNFLRHNIARKTTKIDLGNLSEKEMKLGGEILLAMRERFSYSHS